MMPTRGKCALRVAGIGCSRDHIDHNCVKMEHASFLSKPFCYIRPSFGTMTQFISMSHMYVLTSRTAVSSGEYDYDTLHPSDFKHGVTGAQTRDRRGG